MDSSKDLIKERLSIADVVGTYVKLERAGKNLKARCPFHKEKTPSFNVSPERGTYYCFGCGEKGDIFTFIEKMEGVDFRGALELLATRAGIQLVPYRGSNENKDEKERLLDLHTDAVKFYEDEVKKREDIRLYLEGRGLTSATIEKWHLGYAPADWRLLTSHLRAKKYTDEELATSGLSIRSESKAGDLYDRFRGRIMFPFNDISGRPIAFSGRFFEKMESSKVEEPAKYVNSPETPLYHKSRVLYGLDQARASMRKNDFAIVVEGQMDLLMMHQIGFANTVAASGTALTEEHLRLIGHSTKRLVLALDSDPAGLKSAHRSAALAFSQGYDLRIAAFPDGKDPADVGKEDPEKLRAAIRSACSAVEFFLNHIRATSKNEREMRKRAGEEILPLVSVMQSRIDQAHFIQVIARDLGLPEDDIRAEMAKIKVSPVQRDATSTAQPAPKVVQKPISRLQQASQLILLIDKENVAEEKLKKLIGEDRLMEVKEGLESAREKLLFQIENEEYGKGGLEDLFAEIEKETVKEEIEDTRRIQRLAKGEGDEKAMHDAQIRLQQLIRKQHGI